MFSIELCDKFNILIELSFNFSGSIVSLFFKNIIFFNFFSTLTSNVNYVIEFSLISRYYIDWSSANELGKAVSLFVLILNVDNFTRFDISSGIDGILLLQIFKSSKFISFVKISGNYVKPFKSNRRIYKVCNFSNYWGRAFILFWPIFNNFRGNSHKFAGND